MVSRIYYKLNTVLEQCVHSNAQILEQCSKYSRTVNGAACWVEALRAYAWHNASGFKPWPARPVFIF